LTGGIFEQKNVYTVFCPDGEEILVGNEVRGLGFALLLAHTVHQHH